MKLRYIGSRQYVRSDYDHKKIAFSKENNFICDVEDRAGIALLKTGQYRPVVEEIKIEKEFVCEVCGKECASKIGLMSHSRTHKK